MSDIIFMKYALVVSIGLLLITSVVLVLDSIKRKKEEQMWRDELKKDYTNSILNKTKE
jgi:hypothetical protein